MAIVTPTDCPKSVSNRCVIEVLVASLCCHFAFFGLFCWCNGLCHRTGSGLFLFLLLSLNDGLLLLISVFSTL